jgi:1-phosphofructokinase family hexose kinase
VRCETDAGGKGINAARIIAELGVPAIATGFIGGRMGKYVENVLHDENVTTDFIKVSAETRLNISVEDGTGMPPTTFNQKGSEVSEQELSALDAVLRSRIPGCKYVTAGGSLLPNVEPIFYGKLVELARSFNVPITIDADGDALRHALEARPFLVKPNKDEAERLLGQDVDNMTAAVEAAEKIRELGAEIAIVSMGSDGAALASESIRLIAEPPMIDEKSTIGAGDSMVGGFLAGLYKGLSVQDAFRLGAAAGAATASTDGSEIGSKHVIEELHPQVLIRTV